MPVERVGFSTGHASVDEAVHVLEDVTRGQLDEPAESLAQRIVADCLVGASLGSRYQAERRTEGVSLSSSASPMRWGSAGPAEAPRWRCGASFLSPTGSRLYGHLPKAARGLRTSPTASGPCFGRHVRSLLSESK
jgi:hypothetical protein